MNNKYYFSITKELEALKYISFSQPLGISHERLMSCLWHNEPYSILALKDRLKKILKRIKSKYQINLTITKGKIYLVNPNDVGVILDQYEANILSVNNKPSLDQIASFYNCSKSKSKKIKAHLS